MRRKQRVAFESSAPDDWSEGASSSARLYRRLLTAVESAQSSVRDVISDGVSADQLAVATSELGAQAAAITEHLVIVSRLPFAKRQKALLPLRSQVDDVERLAARIGDSALDARGHGDAAQGLREVEDRLATLETARRAAEGDLPALERRQLADRMDDVRTSSVAWLRSIRSRGHES